MKMFSQRKAPSLAPSHRALGVAAIFGLRPPFAARVEPLCVHLGVIGRGHSGKTALFRSMLRGTILDNLASQLQIDVEGPWAMARMIQDSRETVELLRHAGLPATLDRPKTELNLFEGDSKRVTFSFHEVIGQILTGTTEESPPEQKETYAAYVSDLTLSDVLWVVTPCPPREASYDDLARYEDDIRITGAYLRESLRLRQNARPCSVAVVLTKLDSLFSNPEDAKSQLREEHLTEVLRPLVSLVQASQKVGRAAIFPVTAFGWNNAMLRPIEQDENGKEDGTAHNGNQGAALEHGELEWILKPGASPQPYNLTPLVVWSMLNGMLHQEVEVDDNQEEHALARICRLLSTDLDTMGNWCVHLKGVRLSK